MLVKQTQKVHFFHQNSNVVIKESLVYSNCILFFGSHLAKPKVIDANLCTDPLIISSTNVIRNWRKKDEEKLKDQLEVLKYLCVSITTSKTVLKYYQYFIQNQNEYISSMSVDKFETISLKVSKIQVDIVFEVLLSGFKNQNSKTHKKCAKLIEKILPNMNKEQLNSNFKRLMETLHNKEVTICDTCANTLVAILIKLGNEQLDHISNDDKIVQRLFKQLLIRCDKLQLGNIFQTLIDKLISNKEENVNLLHWKLCNISMQLDETHADITFNCLIRCLKHKKRRVRKFGIELLVKMPMKWQKQVDIFFKRLINRISEDKNDNVRYLCAQAIQRLLQLQRE
ncbi:hypothetical protein RFI_10660 [Reticulomyxa filosa]|uniref:Condensin complex subunit 1 C-terminal domain-containing protein n=1 Tax=Reticulomyxa filosa TaxID=46433 RepID=X6NKP4_RETFI|nr:hypothetical protein RFI_10660 [Reticulomyxa filosa]|eukprot:ETO26478.1 hypothetical protein RFI_10660 [Reticulomyxa filosa]